MPFVAAELRIPGSFLFNALIVIIRNGGPYPAVIGVARNAKIMKPVSGLTGSRASCCRSCTS